MTARLRDVVRTFLHDLQERVPIQRGSQLGELLEALAHEDRRLIDIEPDVVSDRDARIARLIDALRTFSKPGGHFVGCPGDKSGLCSEACRHAQLAIDQRSLTVASDTVGALQQEIGSLRREWRHLRSRLHNQKLIHRRVLRKIEAETGFVMRSPGRPKKPTDVRPDVAAGNTGCPGL